MAKKKIVEMKDQIKTGDIIRFEEKHLLHINAFKRESDTAFTLMQTGSEMKRKADKGLWDFVYELYPEIKGFHMALDWVGKNEPVLLIKGEEHGKKY